MKVFPRLLFILSVTLATPVSAGPFEDGLAAYNAGDHETALENWRPLADAGDAFAQYSLGAMYDTGEGVPEDDAEAVRWFRLAAEQGHAEAQYNLGVMYAKGEGAPQDYSVAHMWADIAATNGVVTALRLRAIIAELMTPDAILAAQQRAKVCISSGYQNCD